MVTVKGLLPIFKPETPLGNAVKLRLYMAGLQNKECISQLIRRTFDTVRDAVIELTMLTLEDNETKQTIALVPSVQMQQRESLMTVEDVAKYFKVTGLWRNQAVQTRHFRGFFAFDVRLSESAE